MNPYPNQSSQQQQQNYQDYYSQYNQAPCYNDYSHMHTQGQVASTMYPMRHMFNVNAHPFVPSNQSYQPHHHHYHQQHEQQPQQDYYQQQIGHYQQQPSAQSYIGNNSYANPQMLYHYPDDQGIDAFATFGFQSQQYEPSPELMIKMQNCKAHLLLNEILVGCEQLLSESEDDAQTWITAIRQRFEDPQMDTESKQVAMHLICEIAYSMEANMMKGTDPQYTFACLMQTLAREIKDLLVNTIMPVLVMIHKGRNALENSMKVRLAMFFAEIYIKVTLENGTRNLSIASGLCEQIEDIVGFQPCDANMKSLMRIFKVAGAELDSTDLRTRVDGILTKMGGIGRGSPLVSESIKAQILLMIGCRERGWDRAPIAKEAMASAKYRQEAEDKEEEGFELTEDETNFLESQLEALGDENNDDEFDEKDMIKEYGKFVRDEIQQQEDFRTTDMMNQLNLSEDSPNDAPEPSDKDKK